MLDKNSTVSAAALENGFANVKSFITQCKKVYGLTPVSYTHLDVYKRQLLFSLL